jgi:hypothetical protein
MALYLPHHTTSDPANIAVGTLSPRPTKSGNYNSERRPEMVRNAPVNYAFQFSGPVTALTARRVRHGVGAGASASPKFC